MKRSGFDRALFCENDLFFDADLKDLRLGDGIRVSCAVSISLSTLMVVLTTQLTSTHTPTRTDNEQHMGTFIIIIINLHSMRLHEVAGASKSPHAYVLAKYYSISKWLGWFLRIALSVHYKHLFILQA